MLKKAKNVHPKISVVMPSYNKASFIARSIESVVSQDYIYKELFIKDGGSTDGTVEIIKKFAKKYPKIIRWVSTKDKGQTDAINYGLKRVKGEILTYLNADDVYKPHAFFEVGNFFLKNGSVMWLCGRCDIIDENDIEVRKFITTYKNLGLFLYSYKSLLVLNYISHMACFFRKEAFLENGDFNLKYDYAMDYDYWLRLGQKYPPAILSTYLASFRTEKSTKSSKGYHKQFKEELEIAKKYTKNKLILKLHFIHYLLTIRVYSIINIFKYFDK